MAIQAINLGTYPNDGTGDDLRTAFQKVNANFSELSSLINISNGTNLGTGVGIFAQRNVTNLEFKTLTSTGGSVAITSTANTVNLESTSVVASDTTPELGGDLDLNGFKIYDSTGDGNIEAPIYGYNVPIIAAMLELLFASNAVVMDFGTFIEPTGGDGDPRSGIDLEMGGFVYPYYPNLIDFGTF